MELEEKLIQEQTTRIPAEKEVREVHAEIENLSATLIQQAHEMKTCACEQETAQGHSHIGWPRT